MTTTETSTGTHRGPARRRVALAAAGVLLVGSGAVGGAAIATGRDSSTSRPAATSQTAPAQTAPGLGFGSGGGSGGGSATAPQFGSSTGGRSTSGTAYTPETAAAATAAQSVGLVEITSTLADGTAAGTGLVLTSDGTVVTNHHVVAGATSVKVTVVSTGKTYTATYVGGDATTDVAVLRLTGASGLTPVTVASTAAAEGSTVTAIGDAGGDGGSLTASPGTVSAVDQKITVQNDDGTTAKLTGLIEMNAYVVPGDSGGAVRNSAGEVVGMNVAASSGSRYVTGFAIPISTVETVANEILAGDHTAAIALGYSGFLGVGLAPSTTAPQVAQVIAGGAAAKAGIAVGDTITKLNGTAITTATQLHRLLAATAVGDQAVLGWTTAGGTPHAATITLGQAPIA
ncbi:MAG: hypothetical protein JWP74_2684 [Marmoricola sp.]|nr:hypothetical protein [Marmoricola sp.]